MKVFISSSSVYGISSKYSSLATNVSEIICKLGGKLVYGGLDTGMMNKCYQVFKYHNLKVKAVYDIKDIDHVKYLEHDVDFATTNTFDRLKEMYNTCDVAIILPGGLEVLSSLFGVIEEHNKRNDQKLIIIFNYENYFNDILNMLNKCYQDKFINENNLYEVVSSLEELEKILERGN